MIRFEPVELPANQEAAAANMPTFLVFERLSGQAAELRPIFGRLPAGVAVVSHNVLTSNHNREVLVVRAASSELVHEWVG